MYKNISYIYIDHIVYIFIHIYIYRTYRMYIHIYISYICIYTYLLEKGPALPKIIIQKPSPNPAGLGREVSHPEATVAEKWLVWSCAAATAGLVDGRWIAWIPGVFFWSFPPVGRWNPWVLLRNPWLFCWVYLKWRQIMIVRGWMLQIILNRWLFFGTVNYIVNIPMISPWCARFFA